MQDWSKVPGLDPVVEVVADVASAFAASGHRLYLVGGVVRDLLLGSFAAVDDIDLTTDARPEVIKALVAPTASALWTQGERFGTIGATIAGRNVEITTHRAEAYDETSRKPVVSFGDSVEDDLSRRDFTINAIAISLPDRRLFDPFDGFADLEQRVLRTPLTAEVSFTDDPLRMMRAARFLPRFDLTPEDGLVAAATELAPRLEIVSVERIHDELERLLALPEPEAGLEFLAATGLLGAIVSPLASDDGARAEAVRLAAAPGSPLVRRAGLLFPLGPTGSAAALRRLRYSRDAASATEALVEAAEWARGPALDDEAIRRIVDRVGLDALDELLTLVATVDAHRIPAGPTSGFAAAVEALAAVEDLGDLEPPVSGGQLIERLGLEPGPIVGQAVAFLREERRRVGPLSEDQAFEAVTAWLAEREPS